MRKKRTIPARLADRRTDIIEEDKAILFWNEVGGHFYVKTKR
ncbi:hypothetical protein BRO54_3599 [Geobacillus proteiniphilus]|uniref:Uncharacterized protein n=1 Tax=Geobacillus proteiniphilus TaxID=860353 RepID=A0A1Q5SKT7_9BACL|nr:hypothetical protein BRO54_3599 [Geobacillus proteiniphilus]